MIRDEWSALIREAKTNQNYYKLRLASNKCVEENYFLENIEMFVKENTKSAVRYWYDHYYDIIVKPIVKNNTFKIWF